MIKTNTTEVVRWIERNILSDEDLNLIVEAVKFRRLIKRQNIRLNLYPGQNVTFQSKHGACRGLINTVNRTTADVLVDNSIWRVSLSRLKTI